MGGAVFPPCCLSWDQTVVEVMKIMVTSLKGPMQALLLNAPNPASGQHRPMPPLETAGHSWASLVSLLWGHCSFLLGPGVHKFLFVPSKSLFPQFCVSSGSSMVGLMATSSKRAYALPKSDAPRAPASVAVHCWHVSAQETLKLCSVSVSVGSLGPGAHKVCLRRCRRRPKLDRRPFPPPPHIKGFSDIWTLQFLATKARRQSFWGISLHCDGECLHWTWTVSHMLHTYAVSS